MKMTREHLTTPAGGESAGLRERGTRAWKLARADEIFRATEENAAYIKHAQEVVANANEAHKRHRRRKTA